MATLESLDPSTPMPAQLQEQTGPIVLVNTFFVPSARIDEFLVRWRGQAEFMKSQPGFLSLQMHRGTAGSQLLMNIAVWASTEALATAHGDPRFLRLAADLPDDVIAYPHIFEKIAVDGVCDAGSSPPRDGVEPSD